MKFKIVLFIISTLLFSGCDIGTSTHITKTVEIDGCIVKYVYYADGPDFFIARCDGTTTTTWQERSGKQIITRSAIHANDAESLKIRLSEIEARDKALSKLSPEDRKALGL